MCDLVLCDLLLESALYIHPTDTYGHRRDLSSHPVQDIEVVDTRLGRREFIHADMRHRQCSHMREITEEPRSSESATPQDPTVGLCPGPYDGPREGALFHDRDTPVSNTP